ncbi:hypothetical protein B296_00028487 [Ensete ventricosum]|uniref:Uncharacterized protein n=1 Tax=Ensete ventricosum TaxID=4639 RepID=A0A427AKE7_ENSVE|nr:hypothetical protein B296_00028487 [Ensete ventricosum]
MDLSALCDMPKVLVGKSTPVARVTPSSLEVEEVRVEATLRTAQAPSPKRLIEKSVLRQEDPTRTHKRVKVAVGKHKSRHGEGSSRAPSKDKELVGPNEEPTLPSRCRSKSMKELCRTNVRKNDEDYYALHMTDPPSQDPDFEM